MKTLYKIVLTFNATASMLFIYLVKEECWIPHLGSWSIAVYIICLLLGTKICMALRFVLESASIEQGIREISITTDGQITVFLGYFFVALSIPDDWRIFVVVYIMVTLFIYNSQTIYFNPLLCLMGYNFYEVYTQKGTRIYVITQEKNIKGTEGLAFPRLRKINEFTFIDEEKTNGLFAGKSKRQKKSV